MKLNWVLVYMFFIIVVLLEQSQCKPWVRLFDMGSKLRTRGIQLWSAMGMMIFTKFEL